MCTSLRTVAVNKGTGSLASVSLKYTQTYEMTFITASKELFNEAILMMPLIKHKYKTIKVR